MCFTQQFPVKKSKLKNISGLCNLLSTSLQGFAEDCEHIDIVFDLYHKKSIKRNEGNRRSKQAGILIDISYDHQVNKVLAVVTE